MVSGQRRLTGKNVQMGQFLTTAGIIFSSKAHTLVVRHCDIA